MTDYETARRDLIEGLVAHGADREHFESMTPEQLARFCEVALRVVVHKRAN